MAGKNKMSFFDYVAIIILIFYGLYAGSNDMFTRIGLSWLSSVVKVLAVASAIYSIGSLIIKKR
jgi:hypothetical protein